MSALMPSRSFGPTSSSSTPPLRPTTPQPTSENPTQSTLTTVQQSVSVQRSTSRTDLLTSEANWSWQELRDYVVSQIETKHGVFPRDARKEYGIFNRFLSTYGADAVRIAKAAFETYDGWWANAPISINRFAKGSDPYFAQPILERLDYVS